MPRAYYNEIDKFAAQWLRNLIDAGLIAPGDVDERSIEDVKPGDLAGYTQCHFFAGVGVWSYALRQAGWPDSRRVWTGSSPCQPFSAAGKGEGFADERHLWPAWEWLIRQCRPDAILGEQVEDAVKHSWLDLVQTDLENLGYAVGATCLPACGFGAPHRRQRLFFVADTHSERLIALPEGGTSAGERHAESRGIVGNALGAGLEGHAGNGTDRSESGRHDENASGSAPAPGRVGGFWSDAIWLPFRDGKARPIKSCTFPMADGTPSTVGRLRAYGNAIVAPVAQEFIQAYISCAPE